MLPKTFDDENLFHLFSVYGELREVHIIRGPEGASKGCAFIKFVKTEASLIAMSDMNDIIPEVSWLTVRISLS
jgi:CUG-BP- and ETR3-like factor